MPAISLEQLVTDACYKNGLLAPGETLEPNYGDYGLRESNRLLDKWNIQANFIFSNNILIFPLTARPISSSDSTNQYWYTIGPAGSMPDGVSNPDFVAPRPPRLLRANFLITSVFPQVRVPLSVLDSMQWFDETVPQLGTSPYPTSIYDDYNDPFSRLYIWPQPNTTGNSIELLVWNGLNAGSRFQAITDTFEMPDGYEDAFMLTLSEKLCTGIKTAPPELVVDAANARAIVRGLNSKSPKMSTVDSGMPGRTYGTGYGNFYDGWPTRLG